jgi:hypothetical protein
LQYDWAIIGAGPAGIASIGKLIDLGVPAKKIAWIDPAFTVGDFGTLWRNVPSNTKVSSFIHFLKACHSFKYDSCATDFTLNQIAHNATCQLSLMAEPLQWISDHLKREVHTIEEFAENLTLNNRLWHIQLKNQTLRATHVILATGANAKTLGFSSPDIIRLSDAIDETQIRHHVNPTDTIAVFGSSHSAILVLRNLVNLNAHKVINFYRSPLQYATYLKDWILFDDTGLKGIAAEWARNNINGTLPENLQRVYSNKENIETYLPQCNKVIYAVGFERRSLHIVQHIEPENYIQQIGIIAPGLFGLGIAYPEAKQNPLGIIEHRVGLSKFMDYLHRVMPIWLKYSP